MSQSKEKRTVRTKQISTLAKTLQLFVHRAPFVVIGVLMLASFTSPAMAQDAASHTMSAQHHDASPTLSTEASALLQIVRNSTQRFQDVAVAEKEGYLLQFGCVSGPD